MATKEMEIVKSNDINMEDFKIKYGGGNEECNVCGKFMKICKNAKHGSQYIDEEDMEKIFDKLAQTDDFRVSFDNDDYSIVVRSHYHENNISHFFDVINFKNAMSEVPDKDFWVRMDYDTISKNPDNSLTVTAAMIHVIHFRTEGDFLKTIIECLEHALENDYFCVHELTIYPYCIL